MSIASKIETILAEHTAAKSGNAKAKSGKLNYGAEILDVKRPKIVIEEAQSYLYATLEGIEPKLATEIFKVAAAISATSSFRVISGKAPRLALSISSIRNSKTPPSKVKEKITKAKGRLKDIILTAIKNMKAVMNGDLHDDMGPALPKKPKTAPATKLSEYKYGGVQLPEKALTLKVKDFSIKSFVSKDGRETKYTFNVPSLSNAEYDKFFAAFSPILSANLKPIRGSIGSSSSAKVRTETRVSAKDGTKLLAALKTSIKDWIEEMGKLKKGDTSGPSKNSIETRTRKKSSATVPDKAPVFKATLADNLVRLSTRSKLTEGQLIAIADYVTENSFFIEKHGEEEYSVEGGKIVIEPFKKVSDASLGAIEKRVNKAIVKWVNSAKLGQSTASDEPNMSVAYKVEAILAEHTVAAPRGKVKA